MSHFAEVKDTKVVSQEAFIAACAEMGMAVVERGVRIRPWASSDEAVAVDLFCHYQGSKYGIGLVRAAGGGHWSMVADWSLTGHGLPDAMKARLPHAHQFPGEDREVAVEGHGVARAACDEFRGLAKQLVNKHTLVAQYRRQGFTARTVQQADGSVKLTLTR